MHSALEGTLDCEKDLGTTELLWGTFLKSKEDQLKFSECFNTQNSGTPFSLMHMQLNFSKKEIRYLDKQISKDKSDKFSKMFTKVMSFKYDFEKAYVYVKKLDEYNNVLARLLQAYIYMISGNHSRAELIMIKIMNKELYHHAITSDIRSLEVDKQITMCVDILKKFENEISKPKLFENFLSFLYWGVQGEFQRKLDKHFTIKRGGEFLRNKYTSVQYGKPFPFIWAPYLFNNSSKVEYLNYLKETDVSRRLAQGDLSSLLFFRAVDGIDAKNKKYIIKEFKRLFASDDFYEKEVLFRVLDDDLFYKFISAHSDKKMGLIANIKRKFYTKQVRENKNLLISILNLVTLGDINRKFILKLVASKSAKR